MKNKSNVFTSIILKLMLVITIFFASCKKEKLDANKIPDALENVSVQNAPGGAIISYELPVGNDVTLITVVYSTDEGGTEVIRYDIDKNANSLTLINLSPVKRIIELYTVNKFNNHSESIEVEIEPTISLSTLYLGTVLESVEFEAVIEGLSFKFQNVDQKTLVFSLSYKDKNGDWIEYPIIESDEIEGDLIISDFFYSDFRLFVSDKKTLERSVTKVFEVQSPFDKGLNKSNWKTVQLASDVVPVNTSYPLWKLWDNDYTYGTSRFQSAAGVAGSAFPQSFTIDLGENQELGLTRVLIHQYMHTAVADAQGNTYRNNNPRIIEVWGANQASDSWSTWTKLTTCESIKPSGSPYNTIPTEEDITHTENGEVFDFPLNTEAYRYVRFNVIETWGGGNATVPTYIRLKEITLYGK